jgi:putative endonuclease
MRQFYVYIMASRSRVLYVGMTRDLHRRVFEHRTAETGFTARYRVHRLVYWEATWNPIAAIAREKEIKKWVRSKKVALIRASNRKWRDLAATWYVDSSTGRKGA